MYQFSVHGIVQAEAERILRIGRHHVGDGGRVDLAQLRKHVVVRRLGHGSHPRFRDRQRGRTFPDADTAGPTRFGKRRGASPGVDPGVLLVACAAAAAGRPAGVSTMTRRVSAGSITSSSSNSEATRQRLALLVHLRDHPLVGGLRVRPGRRSPPARCGSRACTAPSSPMPPNSPVGQATVKSGAWKPPPAIALRAEAVALAQHDREERHGDVGADHEHAAAMAHQRRSSRLPARP